MRPLLLLDVNFTVQRPRGKAAQRHFCQALRKAENLPDQHFPPRSFYHPSRKSSRLLCLVSLSLTTFVRIGYCRLHVRNARPRKSDLAVVCPKREVKGFRDIFTTPYWKSPTAIRHSQAFFPLPSTIVTGPSYTFLACTKYSIPLIPMRATNKTDAQLKFSATTSWEFGQKLQKNAQQA
jgi:hypothetical protein